MSRRRRGEDGFAAMLVAVFVAALFVPLCAIAIDVGRMYVEIQRVQSAADAAALAGVTFLPDDLDAATATARDVSRRNGFPHSGTSAVQVTTNSEVTQLKVTVSSRLRNSFAGAMGFLDTTVQRSAVADYNGPAPMGSPCNTFANEPAPGAAETTYAGSQLVASAGGVTCTSRPDFWAAIAGPDTSKGSGDAVMTRTCAVGNSGCNGSTNAEFDPRGYVYVLKVGAAAVGKKVTVQLFDPAMVAVGDFCENGPQEDLAVSVPLAGTRVSVGARQDDMNTYTQDGNTRYATGTGTPFCTGDVDYDPQSTPVVTSFGLREATDTYVPANGSPVSGCSKQYPGFRLDETLLDGGDVLDVGIPRLREYAVKLSLLGLVQARVGNPFYRPALAQVFRQWVTMCDFTPTRAGDYYLQVRTNVALGGTADGNGGYANPRALTQTGDDPAVRSNGNNRFAMRVVGTARSAVSIAGWEEMSLYANSTAANPEFTLVRVLPSAASKSLIVRFFDVGDAAQAGTLQVLRPTDSNMPTDIAGCSGIGVYDGALTSCRLTNVSSATYNGKSQSIRVPVPANYTCNTSQAGGCWFRLRMSFPGGVNDTTTWSARVEGDPVRLVE